MNLLKIDGTKNMFNYTERSPLIEPETGHSSFFKEDDFNRQLEAEREATGYVGDDAQRIRNRNCKVLFAGELYYNVWNNDGSLIGSILFWNNRSGHFRTSSESPNKDALGLPTTPDLFVSWDDNENANKIQNNILKDWRNWSTSVGAKKFKKIKKKIKVKKVKTENLGSKSAQKYYTKSKHKHIYKSKSKKSIKLTKLKKSKKSKRSKKSKKFKSKSKK